MKSNEKLTETLKRIFDNFLKIRIDKLDKNYSNHSKKLDESFNLIDEMKFKLSKIVDSDGSILTNYTSNDLSKSFCSTTSTKTVNKSKFTRQNSRAKTPFKNVDKSQDKKILLTKKSVTNFNTQKTLVNTKSSLNFNLKKEKENINPFNKTLKKSVSRVKLNQDVSPINSKKSFVNSKVNNITPDMKRNKSNLKLNNKINNVSNLSNVNNLSNLDKSRARSKTREKENNNKNISVSRNLQNITKFSTQKTITNPNINYEKPFSDIENEINVSKILTIEQGLNDDLLLNNKDDLLDLQDGELEILSKHLNWNSSKHLNSPTENYDDFSNNLQNNKIIPTSNSTNKTSNELSEIILSNPIKLDYQEILEDRFSLFFKYFNQFDQIKLLLLNKSFGHDTLIKIIYNLEVEKKIIEEKLNQTQIQFNLINGNKPLINLSNENEIFTMSRGTNKATELLNENLYNKLFNDSNLVNEDILLVYMLYFQFIKHPIIKHINNKKLFWSESCKYFLKESNGKTGKEFY